MCELLWDLFPVGKVVRSSAGTVVPFRTRFTGYIETARMSPVPRTNYLADLFSRGYLFFLLHQTPYPLLSCTDGKRTLICQFLRLWCNQL